MSTDRTSGRDVLDIRERTECWQEECAKCGGLSESYARRRRCVNEACDGRMIAVKYVRADTVRGAVSVSVEFDESGWIVVEHAADGRTSIGGPFATRQQARDVAEGARMMAARLAAKRGAVSASEVDEGTA